MQKEILDILKEKDFITFLYKDWDNVEDGVYTGHRFNKEPVFIKKTCSFVSFTPKKFWAIPYKYNSFYQKYFLDGKKRLFKKENSHIIKIERFSKKLQRWVTIWQNEN